jgi:hypothetical protein
MNNPGSPVHYIHLRQHDASGNVMGHGGTTIAYTTQQLDEKQLQIFYFAAHVNPRDAFNRKIGQMVSRGRLQSARYKAETLTIAPDQSVTEAILNDFGPKDEARKAAILAHGSGTASSVSDAALVAAVEGNA